MPLYTLAEIQAKIVALDTQILETESKQVVVSGGPGQGAHQQRGDLAAMYRERQFWLKEYARGEAIAAGGRVTYVQFERPA